MNPDIETYLQDVFKGLQPHLQGVGRVLVEPDYESDASLQGGEQLATDLKQLLSSQKLDIIELQSHTGFVVDEFGKFGQLQKLVRRVTLHSDKAEGPWVEVAPPGNWI